MSWIMQTCGSGTGGGGGPIQDGVTSTILATVLDLVDSNPLTVAIVDANGDQIASFGGGVQYTEGDVDPSITGTAAMMEGAGNTLLPIQGTVADGLLVNLGANNDITVSGSLPAGTNNIGDVDVLTLPNVVQGDAGSNAQAWWTRIGDTLRGPAAVRLMGGGPIVGDNYLVVGLVNDPSSSSVYQGVSGSVNDTWKIRLQDGFGLQVATKAASTAADAADPALVVAISPNNTVAASINGLLNDQGADSTDVQGPMVQGLVSDVREAYLDSTIRPLSLTADGRLRVSSTPGDVYLSFFGEFGLNGDADNFGICDSPWADSQMSVWP